MNIRKQQYKLLAYADDLVIIVEDPLNEINLIKEKINEYGKLEGLKVNTQKTKVLTKNMTLTQEKELEQKVGFTIESKVRYLGIYFTKSIITLFRDNHLKVLKEIEGRL